MVVTDETLPATLFELYIAQKLSIQKIAKKLDSSYGTIYRRLKKFGIPVRKKTDYPNPFLGKTHTSAARQKISKANKGQRWGPLSEETKKKISEAHKGKVVSAETKQKISKNHANVSGQNNPMWGEKHSLETRKKISKAIKGKLRTGSEHHWYKKPNERVTSLLMLVRTCTQYKSWRTSVYKRDKYTCVWCGKNTGNDNKCCLNADHIKPFALIIKENKITTLEQAIKCKLLWDIKNGRTLCVECHKTTSSFAKRISHYS